MALFSKKTTKKAAKKEITSAATGVVATSGYGNVLTNPRITEKATVVNMQNVYTFDVSVSANKSEIAKAVKAIYGVTPVAVRVVTIRPKMRRNARTGKTGMSTGGKKAYVQLKKGDTINLV